MKKIFVLLSFLFAIRCSHEKELSGQFDDAKLVSKNYDVRWLKGAPIKYVRLQWELSDKRITVFTQEPIETDSFYWVGMRKHILIIN